MPADTGSPAREATLGFDEFVAARSSALWRSAYLLTGDPQRAEDLLADGVDESVAPVVHDRCRWCG